MRKTKRRFFMQQYRAWSRLREAVGPTKNRVGIDRFGEKWVCLFEKYDVVRHRIRGWDVIHTRINHRAAIAAHSKTWPQKNLELTKLWRSWAG